MHLKPRSVGTYCKLMDSNPESFRMAAFLDSKGYDRQTKEDPNSFPSFQVIYLPSRLKANWPCFFVKCLLGQCS